VSKWVACGSFENPKKARQFAQFSSKLDYATQEEAEEEAQQWRTENRYSFIWVEKVGR
jgi:hypothetical protein